MQSSWFPNGGHGLPTIWFPCMGFPGLPTIWFPCMGFPGLPTGCQPTGTPRDSGVPLALTRAPSTPTPQPYTLNPAADPSHPCMPTGPGAPPPPTCTAVLVVQGVLASRASLLAARLCLRARR